MTTIDVAVDTPEGPVDVGIAVVRRTRGIDIAEFAYTQSFLAGPGWEISPDLPLRGAAPAVEGLPGALADSAPDTWGRNLITRRLAAEARDLGYGTPTPTEVDYLLGAGDITRQGALRFRLGTGPFLAEHADVPPLIALSDLLAAANTLAGDTDDTDAVATLLAAGSGSLGGARPKASIVDGGVLHIAKFPHPEDRWDVIRWEAVALDLAAGCGLRTPTHRLIEVDGSPVLLVERFDRDGGLRVPYLSAKSLIGAATVATSDYLEIVEGISDHGSNVVSDLEELWRRIAFSVAINNTDDHPRNHGFLHASGGWTLSPIFDVNPDPRRVPRATSIAGATTADDSVTALFGATEAFWLDSGYAAELWGDICSVVARWRDVAGRNGIGAAAQEEFAPVLDRWTVPR